MQASKKWRAVSVSVAAAITAGGAPDSEATAASSAVSTWERRKWVIMTPAASLEILPAMPTNVARAIPRSATRRRQMPVKSPTSTTQTSAASGTRRWAARSERLPVARTMWVWPWAAATSTCCTTDAR